MVVRVVGRAGEEHGAYRVLLVDLVERRRSGEGRTPLRVLASV